jgi:hypothetical protein
MSAAVRITAKSKRTTAIPRSVSRQRTDVVAGRALPAVGPSLPLACGIATGGITTRGIETGGTKMGTALIV